MTAPPTMGDAAGSLIGLNDGRSIPRLGLGLMRFGAEAQTAEVMREAVAIGYRLFDTATIYGTEAQVGEALRQLSTPRESLFLSTKLWNDLHGAEAAVRGFEASLELLGLEALDLYLIHWPLPMLDRYVETWRALLGLREAGRVRSLGVCNFAEEHLRRLIDETGVAPAVNQVEMHPHFQQRELRAFHAVHGVVTQAWSPLGGRGARLLDEPTILRIARKHTCAPSQVVLAWHLSCGVSVIPKASSAAHLTENLAALELELDADDLAAVAALDRPDGRIGPHPADFSFGAA